MTRCLSEIDFEPFAKDQLAVSQHRAIAAHLQACPQCQARYQQFLQDDSVLVLLRGALKESGGALSSTPERQRPSERLELTAVGQSTSPPQGAAADSDTVTLTTISTSHPRAISISVPRVLGPVRLSKEIGRGGMAVVYQGQHLILGREVAVKFLFEAVAEEDDPEFTRFLEGARAAAKVRHPALTTIHHADLVNRIPYLVMEFVDGPSVAQVLSQLGPFSVAAALAILKTVSQAIGKLHGQGIIHRDIKASNILLDNAGQVYVTDFGLACFRSAPDDLSPFKELAGTPAYMAPEMFDGDVSPHSDVYALGILTYYLLTNQLPFRGTFEDIRRQQCHDPLPLEQLRDRGLDDALTAVVARATEKNYSGRFDSARHFLDALKAALSHEERIWTAGEHELPLAVDKYHRQLTKAAPAKEQVVPSGSYFEHLSKLATSKRDQRDPLSPVFGQQPSGAMSVSDHRGARRRPFLYPVIAATLVWLVICLIAWFMLAG